MAKIDKRDDEIMLIYNSDQIDDRQALHYLNSVAKTRLKPIDISKDKLTVSQIEYLAHEMSTDVSSLVDKSNGLLIHEIENDNLSKESLIKLLSIRPDFLRTPIVQWKGRVEFWDSAYEIIRYEMEINRKEDLKKLKAC